VVDPFWMPKFIRATAANSPTYGSDSSENVNSVTSSRHTAGLLRAMRNPAVSWLFPGSFAGALCCLIGVRSSAPTR
jgi:hypothetical protein